MGGPYDSETHGPAKASVSFVNSELATRDSTIATLATSTTASLASKLDKNSAETVITNQYGLMGAKYSGYTHQDPTAIYNYPMLGSPRRYERLYLEVDEGSNYTYAFWGYLYNEDPNLVYWQFRIQFDDTAELYINDELVVGYNVNQLQQPELVSMRSTESNDAPGLMLLPHTYHKINIYYSEGAGTSIHSGQFRFWYRAGLHSADENGYSSYLASAYYSHATPLFRCFNVWPFLSSHAR